MLEIPEIFICLMDFQQNNSYIFLRISKQLFFFTTYATFIYFCFNHNYYKSTTQYTSKIQNLKVNGKSIIYGLNFR